MYFKDVPTSIFVWDWNGYFPVKPPRPPQGRVKSVRYVGCGDYYEVLALVESIHQGQQLSDDPFLYVSNNLFPLWSYCVYFIQKNYTRTLSGSVSEYLPQVRFTLPIKLVNDFRTADRKELSVSFVGYTPGYFI